MRQSLLELVPNSSVELRSRREGGKKSVGLILKSSFVRLSLEGDFGQGCGGTE